MENSKKTKKDQDKLENDNKSSPILFEILRVSPKQFEIEKNNKSDRLTDLLSVLFIFGIAMFVRFYVRAIFIGTYGDGVFNVIIDDNDPLGLGKYLGALPGEQTNTEGYNDLHAYYVPYVEAFLNGWNPYTGSIVDGDNLGGYVYGPFYIYFISVGSMWFDLSPYDSILYSNLIFDSLCYVAVYMVAKKVTGNGIALIIATLGSFSPIALYYANIRLLNAPAMTFFALVSVYFFLEKRDTTAMFFLAMATLVKQFPLFLALPMGLWLWRRYGFAKGTSLIVTFILFVIVLSLPYIVTTPELYIARFFLPGSGKGNIACPEGGEATNLVHGSIIEACVGNVGSAIDPSTVSGFTSVLFWLVNKHILFYGMILILSWIAFTAYDYMEANPKLYLRFVAGFYTIIHATIARGIYKYYLTMLIPFMLLALLPGNPSKSLNFRLGASINRSLTKWFDPKHRFKPTKASYWLGIITIMIQIVGMFWLADIAITLFVSTTAYRAVWKVLIFPLIIFFIYKPGPVDMDEEKDYSSNDGVMTKNLIALIIIVPISYGISKLAQLYFENDSTNYQKHYIVVVIIIIGFLFLPELVKRVLESSKSFVTVSLHWDQLIMDILGLGLVFWFINLFNLKIIQLHRYMTTTTVLVFGIVLLGLLGFEVWASSIKTPKNAIKKYKELKLITE
jgi:hypothetical protein